MVRPLSAGEKAPGAPKDAQPHKDLDDDAIKTLDARLQSEFKQLYPNYSDWQAIWKDFNRGTFDFDLNNEAVAWCISLGWQRTWANVPAHGPEAGTLKRFQEARLKGGPGSTVEDTAEYLLWLCPAKGPNEQGVEIALISESGLKKMREGRSDVILSGHTPVRPSDDIDKDAWSRVATLSLGMMPDWRPGANRFIRPAAPTEPETGPATSTEPGTGDQDSNDNGASVFDEGAMDH